MPGQVAHLLFTYLQKFHQIIHVETFEIFEEKVEWWMNPECPVLSEWMSWSIKPAQEAD